MQSIEESVRSVRTRSAGRRELAGLLVFGVGIYTWALFPSTDESGLNMALPDRSALRAARDDSVRGAADGDTFEPSRTSSFMLIDLKVPSSEPAGYQSVAAQFPSPMADIGAVSLRDKLQALLVLLHFQPGDVERAALRAKLEALLALPDSVLAQLMEHPDLADLAKTLNDVFLGASDLSSLKAEVDKIDVTSLPGPAGRIDVVGVNGVAVFLVHTTSVQMRTESDAGAPVAELSPAAVESVTVTTLSPMRAASADLFATALAMVTPAAQPAPEPAMPEVFAMTMVSTGEQLAAETVSGTEPSTAPAAPSAAAEPSNTAVVSKDVMSSGNKFEPGDTVASAAGADPSPTTEVVAPTATAEVTTASTATAADPPGVAETGSEQTSSPSGDESAGASGASGASP
ncbi:hypothetical protein [Mycolicibacterium fluoranthenivorans]|nr:hypothetical protein [Mycolicibacterium fluoranthenivorans]